MKPRSSPPIQLAFSCHEDYNQMHPCDSGKFCNACNKVVYDLTHKTDQEILDLIYKNGSVCGKVTRTQLQPIRKSNYFFQKMFASLFITLGLSGLSKTVFAQDVKFKPETPDSMVDLDKDYEEIGVIAAEENTFVGIILSTPPTYKYGGEEGLWKFLEENLVYPKDSIEGKVYVTFTINEFGRVENVHVPRSLSTEADKEVIRVIKMLEFIPGEMGGRPTKVSFQLPIIFKLK